MSAGDDSVMTPKLTEWVGIPAGRQKSKWLMNYETQLLKLQLLYYRERKKN